MWHASTVPTSSVVPGSSRTATARTARSRRTRAALVAAVRDELRANGGFTAATVAARAGCSPATFYSHFGTKDDALTAAFAQTLDDLVDNTRSDLTVDTISAAGTASAIAEFVERQAEFFRVESLVFRTALSRLSDHRPLREAYRRAEGRTLDHLRTLFAELERREVIATAAPDRLAEAFMIASQGLNNPRALRPDAVDLRRSLATGLGAMLEGTRGHR